MSINIWHRLETKLINFTKYKNNKSLMKRGFTKKLNDGILIK